MCIKGIGSIKLTIAVFVALLMVMTISCEGFFDVNVGNGSDGNGNDGNGGGGTPATNTSIEKALEIDLDTPVTGAFVTGDEKLWYVFDTANVDQWDVVQFAVTNLDPSISVRMRVSDPAGNVVFLYPEFWSLDAGANVTRDLATSGGKYFVRLESRYDSMSGGFTFGVKNLDSNDTYAGNDSRLDAAELGTLPAEDIQGVLVGAPELDGKEEDWFKFTLPNDGIVDYIQFTLNNVGETLKPRFEVFREDGQSVFKHPSSVPTAGGSIGYKLATRAQGQSYYIRVGGWYSSDYGPYTLNIVMQDANDEYEPNDAEETAHDLGTLESGGEIELGGTIILGGEQDWYSFTLTDAQPFSIHISDIGFWSRLYVRQDGAGGGYTYKVDHTNGYSLSTDDTEGYVVPEADGTYYVRMAPPHNNEKGDYTMTINYD